MSCAFFFAPLWRLALFRPWIIYETCRLLTGSSSYSPHLCPFFPPLQTSMWPACTFQHSTHTSRNWVTSRPSTWAWTRTGPSNQITTGEWVRWEEVLYPLSTFRWPAQAVLMANVPLENTFSNKLCYQRTRPQSPINQELFRNHINILFLISCMTLLKIYMAFSIILYNTTRLTSFFRLQI